MEKYDYAIIGMGIGGLTTGALLAKAGKKVVIFEQHYVPGGYGHTFKRKGFSFCPGWHYVWNCGKGEAVYNMLKKLGLEKEVTFEKLDPKGFDRVVSKEIDYKIGSGFERECSRLSEMFPNYGKQIKKYFYIIEKLNKDKSNVEKLLRFYYIYKYLKWTLQNLFDYLKFPPKLQLILSGQSPVFLLPPNKLSLVVHAWGIASYDSGAYYPTESFEKTVNSLFNKIRDNKEYSTHLSTEIVKLNLNADNTRIISAEAKNGEIFSAENFIFNGDPKLSMNLIGKEHFPKKFQKKLDYDYSSSVLSVFLGLKDIDLSKYIGKENIFYYSDLDINSIYEQHFAQGIPKKLLIFFNAPSLRSDDLCPPRCHQLVVIAPCNYQYFADLKSKSRSEYIEVKEKYADKLIDKIEEKFIPGLKSHIVLRIVGSPTTSEHFVFAPQGSSYGTNLDPANVNVNRLRYKSPFNNMYYIGAASFFPGFASGISFASKLYEKLTGDKVQ